MRGRKEHVITSVKGDAQPGRLIALAVDVRCEGDPTTPAGQREIPVAYSAVGWTRTKEGAYYPWESLHRVPAAWWGQVVWASRRPGVTWIVAVRAVRTAALLGLWEMIDDGRIEWDGPVGRQGTDGNAGGDVSNVPGPSGNRHTQRRPYGVGAVQALRGSDAATGSTGRHVGAGATGAAPTVVIDDPPTIIRVRVPGGEGRLWLHDARNWGLDAPQGLRNATEEARWLAAAMRRMVDVLAEQGWGGLKATAGSQALATWRRKFMTHRVVAHNDDTALDLEGRAYVGGRCEARRIGPIDGPLYWCDRRSAYGAASARLDVPLDLSRDAVPCLSALRDRPEMAARCLAEVQLETDEPAYPVRTKHGTIYPVGRIFTVLCGPELADAITMGRVSGIGRTVLYDTGPALRAYALALWEQRCLARQAGDRDLDAWLKRLITCLPGKMGQRLLDWQPAPEVIPQHRWHRWWGADSRAVQAAQDDGSAQYREDHYGHTGRDLYALRSLAGAVQRGVPAGWTYDSCPAIACWILADARSELLRAIRAVGWEHALYYDTDSLLLTAGGWERLCAAPDCVGSGLGQWRLVRVVQRATIHGVKHYEHDGEETCAGRPRQDTQDTTLKGRYWYRETMGVALGERHAPRATRRLRTWEKQHRYTLGRVGDGGRVYPHYVEMW